VELDTPDIVHDADKALVVTMKYGKVRIAGGYGGLCGWLTPSQKTNLRKFLDK
jgi:acetoacetate decarboxylase